MDGTTLDHQFAELTGTPSISKSDVPELARRLRSSSPFTRRRLTDELERFVLSPEHLDDELSRIVASRVIAALLPESLGLVRTLLSASGDTLALGELRFSAFVALSDLAQDPQLQSFIPQVAPSVESFLLGASSDLGESAWMAGDMLGDHWPLTEGLPVLLRVAREARHSAGRLGAIHGLSHALGRATKHQQWEIVGVLKAVVAEADDESVRRSADLALHDLRGF